MNKNYEKINFDVFSDIPEIPVRPDEKRRLMEPFDQRVSAGLGRRVKGSGVKGRRAGAWIAACLIVCLAATPLGDQTWAAVKQAFMGIGQYLGMSQQDNYATVIDQTQSRNGVTVTLCEAIGSDHELRISFRATKDGKNLDETEVEFMEYFINGTNWQSELKSTGTGPFGTDLPDEERDKSLHFWSTSFESFDMPLNPTIDLKVAAGGEQFAFSFTLENEAFKAATKQVDLDRTITFRGKKIVLKQLVITPIDQWITIENPENVPTEELWQLALHGSDQNGDPVSFLFGFYDGFSGSRDNQDASTYELDYDVESYTFRAYDEELMTQETLWCEASAVSDEFTVQVK